MFSCESDFSVVDLGVYKIISYLALFFLLLYFYSTLFLILAVHFSPHGISEYELRNVRVLCLFTEELETALRTSSR